jgi:CPA2 family monovalent cation:H+ antiporter-2
MAREVLLGDVGLALGAAGITSLVFAKLRQSAVLGYLAAGIVVGPYLPLPIYADPHRVEALSDFGVVLVMFVVGLELRLRRFASTLPAVGAVALVQIGALAWLGTVVGRLLGWSSTASLFLGGALCISSTMVVSQVFETHKPDPEVRERVLGILVLQDVAAVVLIAVMTAAAAGASVSLLEAVRVLLKVAVVVAALLGPGLLIVPRLVAFAVSLERADVLAVSMTALCFGGALAAGAAGASPALGAFVAGVLVAESGLSHEVEERIRSLRDVFAAIFFVSIGMTVDPLLVAKSLPVVLAVSAVVIAGQLASVTIAGILSGNGLRSSLATGLYLGQIGEFSFVIAGIGSAVVPPELRAIVVGVAAVTTFTTPLLAARADALVHWVDDHLPPPVRTLLVVYHGWFAQLVQLRDEPTARALRAIVLDGALLAAVAVGFLASARPVAAALNRAGIGVGPPGVRFVGFLFALPLVVVLIVYTRRLAAVIVARVFRKGVGGPLERVLTRAVELAVWLAVGAPLAAVLDQFFAVPFAGAVIALGGAVLAVAVWRSARTAGGAVHKAAEQIGSALERTARVPEHLLPHRPQAPLGGIGMATVEVAAEAAGKTLAALDLRARTGATVVAIHRGGQSSVTLPTGHEALHAGDRLALVGSTEALDRARTVLRGA